MKIQYKKYLTNTAIQQTLLLGLLLFSSLVSSASKDNSKERSDPATWLVSDSEPEGRTFNKSSEAAFHMDVEAG
ncbi:MAG: hypothetical protein L3J52_03385, partial [Proteobacteria bacterium]|nr:hypothetical protein [Pseudomonadota bacterium]